MIEIAPMSDEMITYDQAFLYTLTCTHHGCYDWRLPTLNEWLYHSPNIVGWDDKGADVRAFTDSGATHQRYVTPVRTIHD